MIIDNIHSFDKLPQLTNKNVIQYLAETNFDFEKWPKSMMPQWIVDVIGNSKLAFDDDDLAALNITKERMESICKGVREKNIENAGKLRPMIRTQWGFILGEFELFEALDISEQRAEKGLPMSAVEVDADHDEDEDENINCQSIQLYIYSDKLSTLPDTRPIRDSISELLSPLKNGDEELYVSNDEETEVIATIAVHCPIGDDLSKAKRKLLNLVEKAFTECGLGQILADGSFPDVLQLPLNPGKDRSQLTVAH